MESFKMSPSEDKDKKPKTKQEKVTIAVLCVVIFFTFSFMFSSDDTPPSSTAPKQAANMSAIQTELEEYATEFLFEESEPDRWTNVTSGQDSRGDIVIRVTVSTEVPVNETATGIYCDKIEDIVRANAPGHLSDTTAFISQYSNIVKTCTY